MTSLWTALPQQVRDAIGTAEFALMTTNEHTRDEALEVLAALRASPIVASDGFQGWGEHLRRKEVRTDEEIRAANAEIKRRSELVRLARDLVPALPQASAASYVDRFIRNRDSEYRSYARPT